ncbi:protein OXIDATIVE STRESS 3-like [Amaranthus tricolor]|uniref:protein OXIDATIVE STRESS 3-like n=1 Tax=Amaranthus tricolor TaxID=29722 RepID=UPI00258E9880|nr:protein OXIDATIVE STRESS 3-like [Amaranthus tricolor]
MEVSSHMMGMYHTNEANHHHHHNMLNMMGGDHHDHDDYEDNISESSLSSSSSFEDSSNSKESASSSSDLLDDASSPSSSSSSPRASNGPLYELSELMNQLPIKRGLSKYYQGKSQSFTSFAKVGSLEDLAKKESPYQRRLKACRSYGGGLNNFKSCTSPKAGISKRLTKGSLSNLSCLSRKPSFIGSCRPPLSPVL